jgi:cation diffusion facilitator family transporter
MGSDISSIERYAASVRRVLIVTLILNAAVALAKVVYGYVTNSVAMTSDGFHSFFDGVSNVVGLIGIWIAAHPPDAEHPYGHKKYETLFTIIIAVMIFATCFQILKKVYSSFLQEGAVVVTEASFIIMFLTLCVNIFVMLYESKKGKQLGSDFLTADAMHTKSDIFVSLAVVVSLILTKAGYPRADTIVGIIITFFIARIGYGILKDASRVLVDTTRLGTSEIESVVNSIDGVRGCHDIRTRGSSNAVYLDLHVLVDRNLSIEKAHGIADRIEESIKKEFPAVVDIVVHVEPEPPEESM